jgi:transposase
MAAERLSMRQIRDILRQKWELRLSHRAVAQSLGVGLGTISSVVSRAQAAGLDWAQVQGLSDDALESRLYGRPEVAGQRQRPAPDYTWIHAERRRPGVTLELGWLERGRLSMRQVHRAGEKCFVDYAGQKPRLIDSTTGEVVEVELFVAALMVASNCTSLLESPGPQRHVAASYEIAPTAAGCRANRCHVCDLRMRYL